MALRRTKEVAVPSRKTVIASAADINVEDPSWDIYRFRDEAWQKELWRLYDIVGEFRFIANWVGSCCSRVRLYVCEVDEYGRVGKEVEDDPEIAGLAQSIFDGPSGRSEALRSIGVNLTVAGECYILGRSVQSKDKDEWYVVSAIELNRKDGVVFWDDKSYPLAQEIVPGKDKLIRLWTPHPRRLRFADCPARAVMPVLREIEQLTKYVFSQIDSRLVGAGLLPWPAGTDFPTDDGVESAAQSLMQKLAEAGQASLKGEGTAAAVLPIIVEVPPEVLDKIKIVRFDSELSAQALELRREAITRLAQGMDAHPEIVTGTGDVNHWGSWHIDESGIKVHIEPVMSRICQALTTGYLGSALKSLGKDPKKYAFWFDTSPLTVRPQRLTDALNLHKDGLLSDEAVRDAGFFFDHEAPDDEESARRFMRELMLRDPTLFAIPKVRELAGITEEMIPIESMQAAPPPPPPPPETGIQSDLPAPIPDQKEIAPNHPGTVAKPGNPNQMTASAGLPGDMAMLVAAEATVRRALELAGGRLLDRSHRDKWNHIPRHELHTRIQVNDAAHASKLLMGAWTHLPALLDALGQGGALGNVHNLLNGYCYLLLTSSRAHEPELLAEAMTRAGLINGST